MDLRANTAVDVLIGPFVDKTDGNTTEDGLTLPQAEIKLSKNGQALTQKNDNTTAAFDDDGYYNCELDSTDTDTEGNLVLIVHQSANALPVRHEYNVLSEAAWDSLYIAKDDGFMDINIKTVGRADTQETEANNLKAACSNYSVTRGLTGTAVPAAVSDAAGGLVISDAGGLDLDVALKRGMFCGGEVYVDAGGTNSTTWPYGTPTYPTDTIANGKTIADANSLDKFVIHGDLTMSAAMENYTFFGHGHMEVAHRINIDSQSVEHSVFNELVIQGTMTNVTGILNITRFTECQLWALSDIHGLAIGGALLGACSILDGGIAIFNDVGCGALAACTLTLQAPAICIIANMKGVLTLAGMDGGTCNISMQNGSILTIDNTNSAGTINITGTGSITDNSQGGCTVNITKPEVDTVEVGGTSQTANDNGADINTLITNVGTPANIDSGGATLSDNLKKIADDNSGATFDATNDSLNKVRIHIGDGTNLTEAGGTGDHLSALPNQTMNITGSLSGSVGSVSGDVGGDVKGKVDGTVTGKTPAEAGDVMNLAADAIKSTSYDESSAFPIKSNDAGATQIARVGADGDTLETLSDQIDLQATATALSTHDGKLDIVDANVDDLYESHIILKTTIESANRNPTNLQMAAGIPGDNQYNGLTAVFQDGNDDWYARPITDYAEINNVITWSLATELDPKDGGTIYIVAAPAAAAAGGGDATEAKQNTMIAKLLAYVRLMTRSDAAVETDAAVELTAINADEGAGAGDYSSQTHSQEAIIDTGNASWTTGGAGSLSTIINVQPLIPYNIDLANTAVYRMGLMLINSLDDLPSTAEITPGTISIDRKAIGDTTWSSIISDTAMSEIAGLVYYDEVFDSGSNYAEGDSIKITMKNVKITVDANDHEIIGSAGRVFYTSIKQTMVGTNNANTTVPDPAGTAATLHTTTDGKVDTVQADLDIITGSDGAILATTQPNYAPSKAGDNMNLVDDAITASKYDETTAFPVKSNDSGSTEIARTGIDGDTLETLSDQIDLQATSAGLSTHDGKLDTAQNDLDIITGIDGATLAALQPNYAPSKAGDNMNLADDAITASKYDETTAYPIASVDSGVTEIARTGADSDTLETLSDQIDLQATSAALSTHDTKLDIVDANVDDLYASHIILKTTIESANRNPTNLQMATGIPDDNQYNGLTAIFQDGNDEWYARPITDYAETDNVITWSLPTDADPKDGGTIYIIAAPAAAAAGGGDATEAKQDVMIAKLLAYVRLIARSDAAVETDAAVELTAINADEGSGAGDFSSQVDSQEAISDDVGDIIIDILAMTIDGTATFEVAMKQILAYCGNDMTRSGDAYTYRNYDDDADTMVITGSDSGRVRS